LPRPLLPLGACLALIAATPAAAAPPPRPNFVLVVLDDLGYGDLGAYGGSAIQTPNADRLAAEGLRFTQFYAAGPYCSPSRAALLSGRHPVGLGIRLNVERVSARGLPAEVPTLAELLRGAGYATGHFGKWHLGGSRAEDLPGGRGFDRWLVANTPEVTQVLVDGQPLDLAGRHLTKVTTDHAIAFVQAHHDRPFYLNLWYNAPHLPWHPPDRWLARYSGAAAAYAAAVAHADDQLGRLLPALEALGLARDTVVVLTSDNGGTRKALPSNGGLRGFKGDLYEGGIRVPFLVRWPGAARAGALEPGVFTGVDLLPTLLELAGVALPAGTEGRSMVGALLGSGAPPAPRTLVFETHMGRGELAAAPSEWDRWAVREGDWKLVRNAPGAPAELYDLAVDPGETEDVAARHPEVSDGLAAHYAAWRRQVGRVEPGVERVEGAASLRGKWVELDGGAVALRPHSLGRIGDGDFGFELRVWPAQAAATGTLAELPESWALRLAQGHVELVLQVGDAVQQSLVSARALAEGEGASVALSVYAWHDAPNTVRLYLDGELAGETRVWSLLPSAEGVRLGRDATGSNPFRGLLWGASFRRHGLLPEEAADRDGDGLPDRSDPCIGVSAPPGPWLDTDGDGFGNACDADLGGDGWVGGDDWMRFSAAFGSFAGSPGYDPRLDREGDGWIGASDLFFAASSIGERAGPSGVACAGALSCYAR
jgi:arylsulfatase A-like enzyme